MERGTEVRQMDPYINLGILEDLCCVKHHFMRMAAMWTPNTAKLMLVQKDWIDVQVLPGLSNLFWNQGFNFGYNGLSCIQTHTREHLPGTPVVPQLFSGKMFVSSYLPCIRYELRFEKNGAGSAYKQTKRLIIGSTAAGGPRAHVSHTKLTERMTSGVGLHMYIQYIYV